MTVMQTKAKTPEPPYYVVIFTSIRTDGDNGHSDAAKQMLELASKQPRFLGFETARQEIGLPYPIGPVLPPYKHGKKMLSFARYTKKGQGVV